MKTIKKILFLSFFVIFSCVCMILTSNHIHSVGTLQPIAMSSADFKAGDLIVDNDPNNTSGDWKNGYGLTMYFSGDTISTAGTDGFGFRMKNTTNTELPIQTVYISLWDSVNKGAADNVEYSLMHSTIQFLWMDGTVTTSVGYNNSRNIKVPANFDGIMVIDWSEVVAIKHPDYNGGKAGYTLKSDSDKLKKDGTGYYAYPTQDLLAIHMFMRPSVHTPAFAAADELIFGDIYTFVYGTTTEHTKCDSSSLKVGSENKPAGSSANWNLYPVQGGKIRYAVSDYPTEVATYNLQINGVSGYSDASINLNTESDTITSKFGYRPNIIPTLTYGYILSYVELDGVAMPFESVINMNKSATTHTLNFVTAEMYSYKTSLEATVNLSDKEGVIVDVNNTLGEEIIYSLILTDETKTTEYTATNKGVGIFIPTDGYSYYGNVFRIPSGFSGQIFIPFNVLRGSTYGGINNLPFDYITKPDVVSSTIYLNYVLTATINKDSLATVFNNWSFSSTTPSCSNAPAEAMTSATYENGTGVYLDNTLIGNFGKAPSLRIPLDKVVPLENSLGVGFRLKNIGENEIKLRIYLIGTNNATYVPSTTQTYFRIDDKTGIVETLGGSRDIVIPVGFDGTIIVNLKDYASDTLNVIGEGNSNIDFSGLNLKQVNFYLNANKNDTLYVGESVAYFSLAGVKTTIANAFLYSNAFVNPVTFTEPPITITPCLTVPTDTLDVKITTQLDGATPVVTTFKNTLNGTFTYNPEVEGGTFMFWTLNGVVRTDLPQNLTIKVQSKMELVAHFASTGKYSVAFLDANTKLLDVRYITDDTVELTGLPTPARTGADFKGWVLMNNYATAGTLAPETPAGKTYFIAKYEVPLDAPKYLVKVNNVEKGSHPINTVITATTTEPDFVYWMDEVSGAILSYQSSFNFTVLNEPVSIVSVHEGTLNGPMVSIRRFFDYKAGYDTFIGHYELGTDYELIEIGFEHDDHGKHVSKNINPETNEFMVSVNESVLLNNDYKMKAYMTYRVIATNEIVTVYNKSSYVVTLETTVENTATKDTIYAVGSFNDWSFTEGFVTLNKDIVSGKYIATTPFTYIEEPGRLIEYKYVSATSAYDPLINWTHATAKYEFEQVESDNHQIRLGDKRGGTGILNNVSNFKNHPDDPFDENKIRIYVEMLKQEETMYVYFFRDGADIGPAWRGTIMKWSDANNYYYVDMPRTDFATAFSMIVNGELYGQTDNINNVTIGNTFIVVSSKTSFTINPVPLWDPELPVTP
jgi:hypothetical protein